MKKFDKKNGLFVLLTSILIFFGVYNLIKIQPIKAFEKETIYSLTIDKKNCLVGDKVFLKLKIQNPKNETLLVKSKNQKIEISEDLYENNYLDYLDVKETSTGEIEIVTKKTDKQLEINIPYEPEIEGGHLITLLSESKIIEEIEFKTEKNETNLNKDSFDESLDNKYMTFANRAEVVATVSNWDQFKKAIMDGTTKILLTEDIANPTPSNSDALGTAGTLSKSLIIEGRTSDGLTETIRKIDFGNTDNRSASGITLDANVPTKSKLSFKNIEIAGSGRASDTYTSATNALLYSKDTVGKWSIDFENLIYSNTSNKRILYAPTADITMRGTNSIACNYTSGTSTGGQTSVNKNWHKIFEAKTFVVTDGASLTGDIQDMFFVSSFSGTSLNNGPKFVVNKGSDITVKNKNLPIIAVTGNYFTFAVEDESVDSTSPSSAKLYGETKVTDRLGGLVTVEGSNAHYKISDKSTAEITNRWGPATVMMSKYGVFDVDNGSTFIAKSLSDNGYGLGGTIRFRNEGNMTFNITNNSVLKVTKEDVTATGAQGKANRGAAIRFYGGNNYMNVSGSSRVYINSNSNESAIQYTSKGPNGFNLKDKNSKVEIKSLRSAGIDSGNYYNSIIAESGTEFQVSAAGNGSTFSYGSDSELEFDNMLYYDFRQTNNDTMFSGAGTLKSIDSDASIWRKNTNLDGDPEKAWTLANLGLTGSGLITVSPNFTMNLIPSKVGSSYTTTTSIASYFGSTQNRMTNMSRLSGNNASPIVDELRTPTNADKSIFGHVSVPEGVEGIRDAWTDEVTVFAKVTKKDGTSYELSGKTIGATSSYAGLSVYGEVGRGGLFQLENKDGKFFETGDKIEVTKAWRGGAGNESNPDPSKVHMATPSDDDRWVKDSVTTIDVTPSKQAEFENDYSLTNATKQITGTSNENGAKVFIKVNSSWLKDTSGELITTTVVDNKWLINLPAYLSKDAKVDVYLKDTATINPVPSYSLPKTYTQEPDGVYGNINEEVDGYDAYTGYHDAIKTSKADYRFNSAKRFIVKDVIPDKPTIVKSVVSSGGAIASVGDTLTYTLITSNKKSDSEDWKNVVVTDALPEGLKFDSEKGKVMINGVIATKDQYKYDSVTRTLAISVGNIAANSSITTSFDTVLQTAAYNKEIKNKAKASGDSPQEKPFVEGPVNPESSHEIISADSNEVGVPGTTVKGTLSLVSAPEKIDFGKKKTTAYGKFTSEKPSYDLPLIVNDTRPISTGWSLTVTLNEVMTYDDDHNYKMPDALVYKKGTEETALKENMPLVILSTQKNEAVGDYNISDKEWESKGDGFKLVLKASQYRKDGDYTGKMTFSLNNTP